MRRQVEKKLNFSLKTIESRREFCVLSFKKQLGKDKV